MDETLENNEAKEIIKVIGNYYRALDLLEEYDNNNIHNKKGFKDSKIITYKNCREIIDNLKYSKTSLLFGKEREDIFKGILGNIYQSFDGQDIYETIQEKGANLLYLLIKDHPFTDGNKRIGATLFIYFLNFYGLLYKDGTEIIDNNTLAALTLLIAESNPKEKDVIIDLVWLENEDYIVKSPVRRIHKVKTTRKVKETLTDENLEKLKDTCSNVRDLAILELLISTGMRVGELTKLDISDMNFQERSCIVLGKGNSEREVYFSAKSKMYINKYLKTRADNNEALFVSLIKPYNRLGISGIEIIIRNLGKCANINKVHPHKFRRTMATMAIDNGMPIEQVQKLLGHIKIDTTMEYAMVNQNNVKNSHRKYIT